MFSGARHGSLTFLRSSSGFMPFRRLRNTGVRRLGLRRVGGGVVGGTRRRGVVSSRAGVSMRAGMTGTASTSNGGVFGCSMSMSCTMSRRCSTGSSFTPNHFGMRRSGTTRTVLTVIGGTLRRSFTGCATRNGRMGVRVANVTSTLPFDHAITCSNYCNSFRRRPMRGGNRLDGVAMAGSANVNRGSRLTCLHTVNIGSCVRGGVPTLRGVGASCSACVRMSRGGNKRCHHVNIGFAFVSMFWC